ncbi:TlpA family protein disulfide reductase [Niabella beijingensis]|uniref:TlpA family protein disulfide reductase n=1 Tax=Niabella beijingensis TaxID=2872700 RepID=UPI001CBDEA1D|nr:TlpA disulfide reductase family protein [Niabella beijingensis]MBZ4190663.1 TlpA family protein disulfide reductase [Niabella beijingensis]
MKYTITAILALLTTTVTAQGFSDKGTVWLIGNVKNVQAGFFEFYSTGFFDNRMSSVLFNKDGSFKHKLEIEGRRQDIYLNLNKDVVVFTVQDGDSLLLNWDEKDFRNSFRVTGTGQQQHTLWTFQWYQFLNFREPFSEMQKALRNRSSPPGNEEKFTLINDLYNKELRALLERTDSSGVLFKTVFPDLFYKYALVLWNQKLLLQYELRPNIPVSNGHLEQLISYYRYSNLDLSLFWSCERYRDFLYSFPRFAPQMIFNSFSGPAIEFDPVADNYHLAQAVFKIPKIRDWFITRCILSGFNLYEFNKVEAICNRFRTELKDVELQEILAQGYAVAATLKPGKPAPVFTLKDASGRQVSLTDFKGKVVYLDFWGVGCGPCIYDIQNYSQKLHTKYKEKEVLFVSVCVDADDKEWKDALKKYRIEDQVNLIAEGWEQHPVIKSYNVTGIPHYFIIGKDGTIVETNAPSMGELIGEGRNQIDKALAL